MTIWIIGNADEEVSINHLVTSDDTIIRFNNPNPTCTLKANILFITNGYDNINKTRIDKTFLHDDCEIFFRFHPIRAIILYWKVRSRIRIFRYFSRYFRFILRNKLFYSKKFIPNSVIADIAINILKTDKQPSTGIIVLLYFLNKKQGEKIILHNFTFQGWDGHPWKKEEAYVRDLIQANQVELI